MMIILFKIIILFEIIILFGHISELPKKEIKILAFFYTTPPIPQRHRNKFNDEISKKISTSKKRASARFFEVDFFWIFHQLNLLQYLGDFFPYPLPPYPLSKQNRGTTTTIIIITIYRCVPKIGFGVEKNECWKTTTNKKMKKTSTKLREANLKRFFLFKISF